ncbi:hypothetical protein U1Q18_044321, partial [Sarracenia purpurea var. burkii]
MISSHLVIPVNNGICSKLATFRALGHLAATASQISVPWFLHSSNRPCFFVRRCSRL